MNESLDGLDLIQLIKVNLSTEDALCLYGGYPKKIILGSKKSKNIKCPLPGHEDKSPSFTIYKNGRWKCWSNCGSGDVINLVSKLLGISNTAAINKLKNDLNLMNKGKIKEYSQTQNERNILRGYKVTKEKIVLELLHLRNVIKEAKKQVTTLEERDQLADAYHFDANIPMYLDALNSDNVEDQIKAIQFLKPLILGGDYDG